jgi:hypothetical protein
MMAVIDGVSRVVLRLPPPAVGMAVRAAVDARPCLVAVLQQPSRQKRNQRERQNERDETATESVSESAKELAHHAREQAERRKDNDGRERRTHHGREQFLRGGRDGAGTGPRLHAPVNAFDDDDGIVDDEANRDSESAHRHEIDLFVEEPHHQKRGEHGDGQRDRCDECEAPVAQEDEQHQHGEQAADQNGIAHVGDRCGHKFGEVVGIAEMQARRQRPRESRQFLLDALPNIEDVCADLLRDGDRG